MRIQHNIAALNSYRNLSTNNNAVSKNLEKLSSGYRINRAGDDAAGLAISEKMRAQITGLETAQKNANDGISLVQTAEGALTEVHSMLNRMVELADQAANGTYDDEVSRANLQKEVESLKDEINRISKSTNFNGINLLDGSMEKKTVTSGVSNVAVSQIKDGRLGKTAQAGKFSVDFSNATITSTGVDAAKFTMFGVEVTVSGLAEKGATISGGDMAAKVAEAWNTQKTDAQRTVAGAVIRAEVSGSKVIFTMDSAPTELWANASGVQPSSNAGYKASLTPDINIAEDIGYGNQAEQLNVTVLKEPVDSTEGRKYAQGGILLSSTGTGDNGVKVGDGRSLQIGDTTYVFAVGANSQYKDMANVIDLTDMTEKDIDAKIGIVGMRLSQAAKDNKNFKVGTTTVDGNISLTEKEGGVDYAKNNLAGKTNEDTQDGDWTGLVKQGTVDSANSQKGLTLQIGDTADSFNQMTVSVGNMNAEALGIADINIGTQAGAQDAVARIKAAINSVSSTRGDLGAIQNRLEHTINNLSVTTENMTAAESRIRDVDMAKEMMAYTKNNILVQASQAMLAQANQIPQGVLQLLQ